MNLRAIVAGVILLVIAPISAAKAQVLWQGARAGMSVEEVLKALPGATRYVPAPGDKLGDGATELVTAPDQMISEKMFRPRFYFSNYRLEQVTLSLQGADDSRIARITFEDVFIALRAKYGPEVVLKDTDIGKEADWLHGKTNITLFLISNSDTTPLLNIIYQMRVAGDAVHL